MLRTKFLISKYVVSSQFSLSSVLVSPVSRMSSKVPDQVINHSSKSNTTENKIKKSPKTETPQDQTNTQAVSRKESNRDSPQAILYLKDHPQTLQPAGLHNAAKKCLDNHPKATNQMDQGSKSRLTFSAPSTPREKILNESSNNYGKTVEIDPPRYSQYVAKRNQMMSLLSPKILQITAKKDEMMNLLSARTNFAEVHTVLGEAADIVNSSMVHDIEKKSLQSLTNTQRPTEDESAQETI